MSIVPILRLVIGELPPLIENPDLSSVDLELAPERPVGSFQDNSGAGANKTSPTKFLGGYPMARIWATSAPLPCPTRTDVSP